jgi:glutamate N-acetyltransferase/amino-acid N-acetyltransferase
MDAAKAIMTTDTFAKVATATVEFDGVPISISGIAKGSGMIAPDMATMLSFVFTDAPISAAVLKGLLQPAIDTSFNAVTVDSDTSTSDTCLVFATGKAGIAPITSADDPRASAFAGALGDVLHELAIHVVRDGEGATKMVTVTVEGAQSDGSAFRIAQSIANSPLVKTAIAGEDANWGRVVMAVGKAGEPADRDLLSISFGDIRVATAGERDPNYNEAATSAYMKNEEIEVRVDIGLGAGTATVYTCDLTHGYITINGDYRS